eukprot:UN05423
MHLIQRLQCELAMKETYIENDFNDKYKQNEILLSKKYKIRCEETVDFTYYTN